MFMSLRFLQLVLTLIIYCFAMILPRITVKTDKTGTLTKGKPAVTDFTLVVTESSFWDEIVNRDEATNAMNILHSLSSKDCAEEFVLWLFGSLERNSEHLLAAAIVEYAEARLLECINKEMFSKGEYVEELEEILAFAQPSNFVAMTGRGASGTIVQTIDVLV